MIKKIIHEHIIQHRPKVEQWFQEKECSILFPFYASFDLRYSGKKVAPVDANLFPAGFNNICTVDQDNIPSIMKSYLHKHYKEIKNIILLTEEHTHNAYYWDNIATLKKLLEKSHFSVQLCVPGKNITQKTQLSSAGGHLLEIHLLQDCIDKADLVISNNDFSSEYNLPNSIPFNPSPQMGWKYRRKHHFFQEYNSLAEEFSKLINIPTHYISIKTTLFKPFNVDDSSSIEKLKQASTDFLNSLQKTYHDCGEKPFLFLKNNSGTYGLGVTSIESSEEIEQWNYKLRKKMKAAKGGGKFEELILQEGIPTKIHETEGEAEPVIYTLGSDLIGGFLRVHKSKGVRENLNSPGAVFKQLCMSDLKIQVQGKEEENVYGWITRLALLALSNEIKYHSK